MTLVDVCIVFHDEKNPRSPALVSIAEYPRLGDRIWHDSLAWRVMGTEWPTRSTTGWEPAVATPWVHVEPTHYVYDMSARSGERGHE